MTRAMVLAIALAAIASGCRPVKPWQRETLAHPCMTDEGRGEERRAREHMLGARESSQGGSGETGGGCGCN